MGMRYRKRIRLGPLPVWANISRSERSGWTVSWTVKVFGVSWNSRTGRRAADLPGGWSYHEDARRGAEQ